MRDVLAFVSGPYRDDRGAYFIRENIRRAEAVGLELWRLGIATITPHLNTCLWDGAAPDEVWLAGDLVILSRCDLVMMVPGWEWSDGAHAERDFAERHGRPIFYWPDTRAVLDWLAQIAAAGENGAESAPVVLQGHFCTENGDE